MYLFIQKDHTSDNLNFINVGKLEREVFYPWIKYNTFGDPQPKPNGMAISIPQNVVDKYFCGSNVSAQTLHDHLEHPSARVCFTRYNFSKPYLVIIHQKEVYVHQECSTKRTTQTKKATRMCENTFIKKYSYLFPHPEIFYTQLIKKCKCEYVYIGESQESAFTGYRSFWDKLTFRDPFSVFKGNTILLSMGKNTYIYIGSHISNVKFNETVEEYLSPVGKSDVPEPMLVGEKSILFLEDDTIVPKTAFPDEIKNWNNAPLYYQGKLPGLERKYQKY